jgi:hypothetical protein
VKRIDYYAQPQAWNPKWIGAILAVIFSAVAVFAVVLIVHLTRPAHADTPPVQAAAVPAPAAPAPVVTEPPVQPAVAPAVRSSPVTHAKQSKSHKKSKAVASGKAKANAILARHDSRQKRKQKDDLDRLLGL